MSPNLSFIHYVLQYDWHPCNEVANIAVMTDRDPDSIHS